MSPSAETQFSSIIEKSQFLIRLSVVAQTGHAAVSRVPAQTPLAHLSCPGVQALRSLQSFVLLVPLQAPPSHLSWSVHSLLSLQAAVLFVLLHAPSSHLSSVQSLPSVQVPSLSGTFSHLPPTHFSAVQGLKSSGQSRSASHIGVPPVP